jgi:integrase
MATLRKLPSGAWNVQVRRKGFPPVSKSFPNKKDALAWARAQERARTYAVDVGYQAPPEETFSLTVGELLERYLLEVTPRKKGSLQEVSRLNGLKRRLGHLKVLLVQPSDIAKYRDHRLTEVSPETVCRELGALSHVFEVARLDWGIRIESNPVKLIRKPKIARARDRRLNPGELERLLQELQGNPTVHALLQFTIETGMRRGELAVMRWENVRLKERVVFLPDTKNGDSRTVPLSTKAVEILSRLHASCQADYRPHASRQSGKPVLRRKRLAWPSWES